MRILAVIPACEGSVSLPNKNLRVINGKPLIYYVIRNARNSRYITDTIVTTNSNEIISIARQMGAMSRLRDPSLCGEEVSLDTVVFDVFQQLDLFSYDYVVTMQSISPTLRVETLDAALERCIREDCDTLISVSNRPRFYWTRQDGELVPIQRQRKSRHLLPPFFVETGAFLITKSRFVRPDSRLGETVRLFELSGGEAIDVDTFGDLKQVENILCQKSTAFYVNGNNQLGLGHVYRVIQLADELFSKPDIYYDRNQTERSVFGETTHNLIPVDGEEGLFSALRKRGYDRFINDILSTSRTYMAGLRASIPGARIINFEDEGEGSYLADLVFNALYEENFTSNVRAGEQYFIASKLFLIYDPIQIRERVRDVFVAFGAADPQNYSDRVLRIASRPEYQKFHFHVVIGRAKENAERLLRYNEAENIEVLHNIDNMPEVMSKCDVALTSRGRTGYELAVLGIPSITVAQNERETLHSFLSEKNGFTYLGLNPSDEALESALNRYLNLSRAHRCHLQELMLSKDLRNGRKHVVNLIDNL